MFSFGYCQSGHLCNICLHPDWQSQPEKPWLWAQIKNHQFAELIYHTRAVSAGTRNWNIKVLGEMIYDVSEDRTNLCGTVYWVAIKLNWVVHDHLVIDVSEVDWHITLGYYMCSEVELSPTGVVATRINEIWNEYITLDLVIADQRFDPKCCIMWEFNTLKAEAKQITRSEQILSSRLVACASEKRCLTKHPRLHLSQWNRDPALASSTSMMRHLMLQQ